MATIDEVRADPGYKALSTIEQAHVLQQLGMWPGQAGPAPKTGLPELAQGAATAARMAGPLAGRRFGTAGVAGGSLLGEWIARRLEGRPDNPSAMVGRLENAAAEKVTGSPLVTPTPEQPIVGPGAMPVLLSPVSRLIGALVSKIRGPQYDPNAFIPTPNLTNASKTVANQTIVPGTEGIAGRVTSHAQGLSRLGQLERIRSELPAMSGELKPGASEMYKALWDDVRAAAATGDKNALAYHNFMRGLNSVHQMREAAETLHLGKMTSVPSLAAGALGATATQSPLGAMLAGAPALWKLGQAVKTAPPSPGTTAMIQSLFNAAKSEGYEPDSESLKAIEPPAK